MNIQVLINVALAGTLVVSYGSRLFPHRRANERRRKKFIILHRLKACGRTSGFELEMLCRSSNAEPLLREMEREGLISSFTDAGEVVVDGDEPTIYYILMAKGERYIEENVAGGRAS